MTHRSLVQALNNIRNDRLLFFSLFVLVWSGLLVLSADLLIVCEPQGSVWESPRGQDFWDDFLSARLRDTSGNFPRTLYFPQREEHKVTAFVPYINGVCQGDSIPLGGFIVSLTNINIHIFTSPEIPQ